MLRISTITQIICIIILELVILDLGKTEHQAFHNNKTQDESPWKLGKFYPSKKTLGIINYNLFSLFNK